MRSLLKLPSTLLIATVKLYQRMISPWLGAECKFQPTCSRYFIAAVEKYGAVRGGARGVWRLCRCHPWSRGGYDPP